MLVTIEKEPSEYFQWLHFWNQWVPLIKTQCRLCYLLDFDLKIHSGQRCGTEITSVLSLNLFHTGWKIEHLHFLNVPWAKAQKCVLKPLCKNDPQYWDITTSFLWKLCSFFLLKVEPGLFFFLFLLAHTKQTLLILKLLPRLYLY